MHEEDEILLIEEEEEPVTVFATIHSPYSNEVRNAGVTGYKAGYMFEVWAEEYDKQSIIEYKGRRYPIRRTFGSRPDGKMELYTEEKQGVR